MKKYIAAFALSALITGVALGQSHQPYAGPQTRPVKALSDEQIADLRAGRGMGLALAAELNGYPGPSHVIELADALALQPDQRARVQQLFEQMKAEAIVVGNRLIDQEAGLDRQFVARSMTPATLAAATSAIGQSQAELRATHLRYHLLTIDALTPEQMRRYAELRGYSSQENGIQNQHQRHR